MAFIFQFMLTLLGVCVLSIVPLKVYTLRLMQTRSLQCTLFDCERQIGPLSEFMLTLGVMSFSASRCFQCL